MKKINIGHSETIGILLAEGFVSVSLQIYIIRQIIPFSGSNITVTSLIIGIFLACLALGYHAGGSCKNNHLSRLNKNLMISAFIISIGFSYTSMNFFLGDVFPKLFESNLVSTTLYLSLFLSPPIFLLGQTMPLLTNFLKEQNVSKTTGLALSVNTVGSVIGSIGTSLILMHYFGMVNTLLINISILCMISIYINRYSYTPYIVTVVTVMTLFSLSLEQESMLYTNEYGNYEVRKSKDESLRYLVINNSFASGIHNNDITFKYTTQIRMLMRNLGIKKKEVLVLGAGGFTISLNDKSNNYTYVDIDPDLKRISEDHFLKDEINGKFIVQDARIYLKYNEKKYDAIIVDLFTHRTSMPWHVSTKEFMDLLETRIKDDGYAFFNIINKKDFGDNYSKRIDNTIHSSFGYCYKVPAFTPRSDYLNLIYGCRTKRDYTKNEVYVDSRIDIEIDSAKY